jgi:predicted transport protein
MNNDNSENLALFLKELKTDKRLNSFDEAATKQTIILRILSLLGWDSYNIDEVCPEYPVSTKKVDYSLRNSNKNKVFIEVKRVGEDLDKHQEQLLNYSFEEGVHLAVLTNGITWSFYLPLQEGNWEKRKFYTIDIHEQSSVDAMTKLFDYLSKDAVLSGEAISQAKLMLNTRQKEYEITKALPLVWDRLINHPDDTLIDLIADDTEKLCGYRPDVATVKNFLSSFVPGSVEDSVPKVSQGVSVAKTTNQDKKSLEYVLKKASPSLKELFMKLRSNILTMGDNVREMPNDGYCDYRKSSTFATINVRGKSNRLFILVKMGDRKIIDPQKYTSPLPDDWGYGKLNTRFEINSPDQLEYATKLIKQAYDYVP